tara:strand:- start:14370 stop:14870 length:501 start_codon:yes stop_codon:yes gene_type:complete
MSFEQTKFGYAGGATTADSYGVSNHFGPRKVGKGQGTTTTEGFMNELTLDLDGELVGNEVFPLLAPQLPAGALIDDVYLEVSEAFVVGGTSPVLDVGTATTEATNGVTITESQLEVVGVTNLTSALAGTWTNSLTAVTNVGLALGGTSPTVTDAGKARLVIRYIKV